MANRPITNCGDCAYVKKEDGRMWCPFHDLPVNSKLVCDDFLDEYDSPQWQSLAKEMNAAKANDSKIPQFTSLDVLAYVCTVILLIACTFLLLGAM